MTDNEIIKALECCIAEVECENCPLHDNYAHAGNCLTSRVLMPCADLINRQKAEIERLNAVSEICGDCHKQYAGKIELAKSEARKEFAERLKQQVLFDGGWEVIQPGTIDNLVKEMEE